MIDPDETPDVDHLLAELAACRAELVRTRAERTASAEYAVKLEDEVRELREGVASHHRG